jgi:hypothetical protein
MKTTYNFLNKLSLQILTLTLFSSTIAYAQVTSISPAKEQEVSGLGVDQPSLNPLDPLDPLDPLGPQDPLGGPIDPQDPLGGPIYPLGGPPNPLGPILGPVISKITNPLGGLLPIPEPIFNPFPWFVANKQITNKNKAVAVGTAMLLRKAAALNDPVAEKASKKFAADLATLDLNDPKLDEKVGTVASDALKALNYNSKGPSITIPSGTYSVVINPDAPTFNDAVNLERMK